MRASDDAIDALAACQAKQDMKTSSCTMVAVVALFLAACGDLPPPHVLAEAPRLARIAELLKAPPLRPVPTQMAELMPPCESGGGIPYSSLQFAEDAGVVVIAGRDCYGVLDIGTGEVIATGTGTYHVRLSRNGRVVAVDMPGSVELRVAETGENILVLAGASGDEFDWVDDSSFAYVAPPVNRFADPRVVFVDLATGLESSLVTVPARRSESEIHDFVAGPEPGRPGRFVLEARSNAYDLVIAATDEGRVASVSAPWPLPQALIRRASFTNTTDRRLMAFEGEGIDFYALPSFAKTRVETPGFTPIHSERTADSDRFLIRGHFKDDRQRAFKRDGITVWNDFYYSLSRNRLAPVAIDVRVDNLIFVRSTRGHMLPDERALHPYALPSGGEEGEIDQVLATARSEALAVGIDPLPGAR